MEYEIEEKIIEYMEKTGKERKDCLFFTLEEIDLALEDLMGDDEGYTVIEEKKNV
jgi:hypothetical protein